MILKERIKKFTPSIGYFGGNRQPSFLYTDWLKNVKIGDKVVLFQMNMNLRGNDELVFRPCTVTECEDDTLFGLSFNYGIRFTKCGFEKETGNLRGFNENIKEYSFKHLTWDESKTEFERCDCYVIPFDTAEQVMIEEQMRIEIKRMKWAKEALDKIPNEVYEFDVLGLNTVREEN